MLSKENQVRKVINPLNRLITCMDLRKAVLLKLRIKEVLKI
jgi:hypothetical protein